jgi:N-acyl amino acid synthase of PEP-CTERM/exosortase system
MKTPSLSETAPSDPALLRQPAEADPSNPALPAAAQATWGLAEAFMQHLQPQIARSELQRREIYRLRHQVYCEELRYEALHPLREERDPFDAQAVHCSVRHRRSGVLAGTVRLVGKRGAHDRLPLETHCAQALTHPSLQPRHFAPHEVCEISRLAVPAMFRKQSAGASEGAIVAGGFTEEELRSFPAIAIGLYMAAVTLSHETRRHHVFVMMEPRLARGLAFVGIRFQALGEAIEYHGKRGAYYIDTRQLPSQLAPTYLDLLQVIASALFPRPLTSAHSAAVWF